MEKYTPGSMAEADAKSAKLFTWIAISAFIVLHVLVFIIPAHPGANIKASPALLVINIAAVIWLAVCVVFVLKDAFWITQSKWPFILLLVLAFASAVAIGYCPNC